MDSNIDIADVLNALDRAKAYVPKDWDYLSQDENVMLEVMELDYDPKPLGNHLGVNKDIFPAAAQLEDDEIKMLVDKILDTWATYNYIADLPEGLPVRIAYEALLSVWDETVTCCPFGSYHFDFYDQDLDQYVDPKYKKCSYPDTDDTELPF